VGLNVGADAPAGLRQALLFGGDHLADLPAPRHAGFQLLLRGIGQGPSGRLEPGRQQGEDRRIDCIGLGESSDRLGKGPDLARIDDDDRQVGRRQRGDHRRLEAAGGLEDNEGRAEGLQMGGSFKIRGAFNKISQLSDEERSRGVIAASAGNHAQGVALAAKILGVKAIIVCPEFAPLTKINATKSLGVFLQHDAGSDFLVGGIDESVKKANRDRLDTSRSQTTHGIAESGLVQLRFDRAIVAQAFRHFQAKIARYQRRRRRISPAWIVALLMLLAAGALSYLSLRDSNDRATTKTTTPPAPTTLSARPVTVATTAVVTTAVTTTAPPVTLAPLATDIVYFAAGSTSISTEGAAVIDAAVAKIKANPGITVKLTGVADSSGSAATNAQVSQRRAQTVQDALKAKGADAKFEITAAGTDATVSADKARRVEIVYVRP